jgi:hypothetical protein
MQVAQHFSAGLASLRASRPVRDDRSGLRASSRVESNCRHLISFVPNGTDTFFKSSPSNKLLGYFHSVPEGRSNDCPLGF